MKFNFAPVMATLIAVSDPVFGAGVHTVRRDASAWEWNGTVVYRCPHVRLSAVLGISDDVLSDTNRFPRAWSSGPADYLDIKLEKPFCGFGDATIRLNDFHRDYKRDPLTGPNRLRGVRLKRELGSVSNTNLIVEAQKICDEISLALKIRAPVVCLGDFKDGDEYWEDRRAIPETTIGFDLSGRQQINLIINETHYVSREGTMVMISPASLELVIAYNYGLCFIASRGCHLGLRVYSDSKRAKSIPQTSYPADVTLGPDCATLIATQMAEYEKDWKRWREKNQN